MPGRLQIGHEYTGTNKRRSGLVWMLHCIAALHCTTHCVQYTLHTVYAGRPWDSRDSDHRFASTVIIQFVFCCTVLLIVHIAALYIAALHTA
jgi:hypothetical protein